MNNCLLRTHCLIQRCCKSITLSSYRNFFVRRKEFTPAFTDGGKKGKPRKRIITLAKYGIPLVGVCFLGAYYYYQIFYTENKASEFEIKLYRMLPLKSLSRGFSKFMSDDVLPRSLHEKLLQWYIKTYKVDMDDPEISDLNHYRSIGSFFVRGLKQDRRPLHAEATLVSPSDGKVLYCGRVEEGHVEQVKGVSYSVQQFLGPQTWPTPFNGHVSENAEKTWAEINDKTYQQQLHLKPSDQKTALYHCIIYLGPGDYHGFHIPTDWRISLRRHFAGELLSVDPSVARWIRGLFCLNERVVYLGEWQHGFFSMAPVGATNVGSIQVFMDENLETNKRFKDSPFGMVKDLNFVNKGLGWLRCKKGELFGTFKLGSSIVLIFEAPENFKFCYEPGQVVKLGQPLGKIGDKEITPTISDAKVSEITLSEDIL